MIFWQDQELVILFIWITESKPQVKPKPKLVVDNVCMVEKSSQSDEEVNIIGEEWVPIFHYSFSLYSNGFRLSQHLTSEHFNE